MTYNKCFVCNQEFCDNDLMDTLKGEPICRYCYRNAIGNRIETQEIKEIVELGEK